MKLTIYYIIMLKVELESDSINSIIDIYDSNKDIRQKKVA